MLPACIKPDEPPTIYASAIITPESMCNPDPNLSRKIRRLCATGYVRYDAGDYKAALRLFYQAWLQLPKPQMQTEAAGWVLTAIGDAYFRSAQYQLAKEALHSALHCPNMHKAPFIYLRLGQCQWELELYDNARRALLDAYHLAGTAIFADEDRKYYFAIAAFLPREDLQEHTALIQPITKRFQA